MSLRLDEAIEALAFAVSLVPLGDDLVRLQHTLSVADQALLEAKFALDAAQARRRANYADHVFANHQLPAQPVVTPRSAPTLDDLAL